jgi:pSer/pThr/pTyr-binding forkhead associated (FHA) protein
VVLRDLGSTNGTFVGDERVEGERTLAPGDAIRIGEVSITLCRLEGDAGGPASTDTGEAQTMVFEAPAGGAAGEALTGDLAQIPMFAVLQMLEMGSQTGALEVRGPDGPGHLWLAGGRPVHAETAKAEGEDAALEIAQVQSGRFEFAPGDAGATRSLDLSVTELVLEASRLLDEASGVADEGPDASWG